MLQRKLQNQEAKTEKFKVKQGKVREIEALNRKIQSQKTSRKLTPTQMARREKIKSNTKKALMGFSNLVSSAVSEVSKKPKAKKKSKKSKRGRSKNSLENFF